MTSLANDHGFIYRAKTAHLTVHSKVVEVLYVADSYIKL